MKMNREICIGIILLVYSLLLYVEKYRRQYAFLMSDKFNPKRDEMTLEMRIEEIQIDLMSAMLAFAVGFVILCVGIGGL